MSAFDSLAKVSTIVVDSGEIDVIKKLKPTDATTNPTHILTAAKLPQYSHLIDDAIASAKANAPADVAEQALLDDILDRVLVNFGVEILKLIPGKISTEIDARLSFDTEGSVARARKIAALYKEKGIDVGERLLVKVAATWEGIRAAEQLEKEGIHCNLTLIFNFYQAVACAEANVSLVSPFVARVMDWYKQNKPELSFAPADHPGVVTVRNIYNYYKKFGHNTVVMGASFRSLDEIKELAGCDKLTIWPKFLAELEELNEDVPAKLSVQKAQEYDGERLHLDEQQFRWRLNEDEMATHKLAEGIRGFSKDILELERMIKERL